MDFGRDPRNEVDDYLVTDQRFATPVLTDEREVMLDFVPLPGSRRQVVIYTN